MLETRNIYVLTSIALARGLWQLRKLCTSAALNYYTGTPPGKKVQWVECWNVVSYPCCNLIGTPKFLPLAWNVAVFHQTLLPHRGVRSGHETSVECIPGFRSRLLRNCQRFKKKYSGHLRLTTTARE